jgi:phosphoribosylformylglycinamidine (FGAM) synthase PurS component
MQYQIELFVKLKIPDVTASTARNTLQRRLGYADVLRDLQREDYWDLTVEAESEDAARALGVELAERTNVFVNPNKHTYRLNVRCPQESKEREVGGVRNADGGHDLTTSPPHHLTVPPLSPGEPVPVRVLTGFLGDASASLTQDALQGRLGYGQVIQGVERGTLWTLTLNADSPDQARQWAEEMVVTRGGQEGLLVNPHSQWWRWM